VRGWPRRTLRHRIGPGVTGGAPTVACPDCAGLACRVEICGCRDGGGIYLIDLDRPNPLGSAWSDCVRCDGDGTYVVPCLDCHRQGRRRAQLVVTVANGDTGAVASAAVTPGTAPAPQSDGHGGWQLDLTPTLRRRADRAGAASIRRLGSPRWPVTGLTLPIDRAWRPELPADQRYALEAAAVARHAQPGWLVYLAASSARCGPTLAGLGRLALGLGLSIRITARGRRRDAGDSPPFSEPLWSVEVVPDVASPAATSPLVPVHPDLSTAVPYGWETLDPAVAGAVPVEPSRPIPVPQAAPVDSDGAARRWSALVRRLRRLAYDNPGRTVLAQLDHGGERTTVQRATVQRVATSGQEATTSDQRR
jgi:hypothetical protein